MLNLKKTAVAVLALGSSAVFAGTMGPACAPANVTVPCEKTAWNVGAQALFLQPAYLMEGNYPQVVVNPEDEATNYQIANSPYQWGFMVEGSYHFGMGNDVNVNWYRVHNTNDVTNPAFQSDFDDFAESSQLQSESASQNVQWDQVDVELGQHIDFGDMKSIRLHGGVEYARIATEYKTATAFFGKVLDLLAANSIIDRSEVQNSTFNGFGPRGGVDAVYQLGNGISLYGKGAGSLLVGPSSFADSVVNLPADSFDNGLNASAFGSHTLIVPELEGKLGVTYDYAMAQGDLQLDVGWMWINYFNAQQNGVNGDYTFSGTVNEGTPTRGFMSQNDFGLQGLYFGAKWTGNV